MFHRYQAYQIPIISELELSALAKYQDQSLVAEPIFVKVGELPLMEAKSLLFNKSTLAYNEHQFYFEIEGIARYFIQNGNEIIIEPISQNLELVLTYFYTNCLAVALFQRNLIPFHVSGVFVEPHKVLLFAASSGIGKTTTALKLSERGYPFFTDDTALIETNQQKCYATASYPMLKLWQSTLNKQNLLDESKKQPIYEASGREKFSYFFHEKFENKPVEVVGIVFLEQQGVDIKIEKLNSMQSLPQLITNIYRVNWLNAMNKQKLQFESLMSIVQKIPAWKATRPASVPSFDNFAQIIDNEIIKKIK